MLVESDLVNNYHRILSGKLRRYEGFSGWQKRKLWKSYLYNLRDIFGLSIGCIQAISLLLFKRPALVFSKGGYPALPVCLAARILRIPVITHDSDATSGLAHRPVRATAKLRLFGVKPTSLQPNWRYVGVPISVVYQSKISAQEVEAIKQQYGITSKDFILVTGGGGGARNLNQAILEIMPELAEKSQIVLLTGKKYYQPTLADASNLESKLRQRLIIVEFSHDMPNLLRGAQIIVSRAGATALAEIAAAGKPSIIVPNDLLPGGHQTQNANSFIKADATMIVKDYGRMLDARDLLTKLNLILTDHELRQRLADNARQLAVFDSTHRTVEAVFEVLDEKA